MARSRRRRADRRLRREHGRRVAAVDGGRRTHHVVRPGVDAGDEATRGSRRRSATCPISDSSPSRLRARPARARRHRRCPISRSAAPPTRPRRSSPALRGRCRLAGTRELVALNGVEARLRRRVVRRHLHLVADLPRRRGARRSRCARAAVAAWTSVAGGGDDHVLIPYKAPRGALRAIQLRRPVVERSRGIGVRLGHQLRAPGRHHLRDVVHLRPRRQAVVAVDDRQQDGGDVYAGTLYATTRPGVQRDAVRTGAGDRDAGRHGHAHLHATPTRAFAYTVDGVTQTKSSPGRSSRPGAVLRLGRAARPRARRPTTRTCGGRRRRGRSRAGASISPTRATSSSPPGSPTSDGKPLWLSVTAPRTGPTSTPARCIGPRARRSTRRRSIPPVLRRACRHGGLTFADGNRGTFAYTVNGIAQTKAITRQVFGPPGTTCR